MYMIRIIEMIKIESTPNLTGVKITGSFDDLYELVEAFYDITIDEFSDKHYEYMGISTRLLGLSYDVRHAYQGDREIELIENGMNKDTMKFHSKITSEYNVHYSCNYLYPEMFFCMIAINDLIVLRIKALTKTNYIRSEMHNHKIIWDKTISVLRAFQGAFAECVKNTLKERSYAMWLKEITRSDVFISGITSQYIDIINIDYLKMNKEKRLKNFSKTTKLITQYYYNEEHERITEGIFRYAEEHKCDKNSIIIKGVEYPEDIVW